LLGVDEGVNVILRYYIGPLVDSEVVACQLEFKIVSVKSCKQNVFIVLFVCYPQPP